MRHPPIHWYEGLFLRPHHLQAADRYWTEVIQTSQQWDHPFHYGLLEVEFSEAALKNNQFDLQRLQARMRDGTLVSIESGENLGRLDLKNAFEGNATVDVLLGVPKWQQGGANVGSKDSPGSARFVERQLSVQDDRQGGNDQDISFRVLNAKLLLSSQDLAGYECLPIARIRRTGEGDATLRLDDSYIPPVVSIEAWPGLGRNIVREIYEVIGARIEVLSQELKDHGIGLDSRDPGDTERIIMLCQLNAAYNTLDVLAFARGVHPLAAYTELARIAGQLSIFAADRRAAEVPHYDHENLGEIFREIQQRITVLMTRAKPFEYEQRYFYGHGATKMKASLVPRWFQADWQWYIGVRKGDLTVEEIRTLLSPGQLDWKLASDNQVDEIFTRGMVGLQLEFVDRPIRALPSRQDWIYFEVPRKNTPIWRDVQATESLAMRFKQELIVDPERLDGNRQLSLRARGKTVTLEFAVFAVPMRTP